MMESDSWPTLTAMFFDQAERLGERRFLWVKSDGRYRALSWAETAERARALAQGLRSLGLAPGDRVILVSENRPEWLIADVAIMSAGCVTVPSYTTNTTDDHLHVIEDSGARAAIVSTAALAERLLPAVARAVTVSTSGELTRSRAVITSRYFGTTVDPVPLSAKINSLPR